MKRVLKWIGMGFAGLIAVALLAGAAVYVQSERVLRRQYGHVPLAGIPVSTDAESIAKGKRLATIYGCFNSCHGERMQGRVLESSLALGRIVAPNLTRIVPEYSNAELERLLRRGVKRDGTSTFIMPSSMFSHVSDEDLANVIAFVRSSPVVNEPLPRGTLGPLVRFGIVAGMFKPHAEVIAAAAPQHAARTDRSDRVAFGKYLVMTTCTECHGPDLQGDDFLKAPSLSVMAGYSDADFRRLMKTGIAIGDRKLGLMTEMGETRFPSLTDEELEAMQSYLREAFGGAMAAVPEPRRSAEQLRAPSESVGS